MVLRGMDSVRISREVASLKQGKQLDLYLPARTECTEPGCGLDAFGQPRDITCSSCDGKGYTEILNRATVWVRLSYLRTPVHEYSIITTGIKGPILLGADIADRHVFEKARDTEGAYGLIDSRKLRVNEVHIADVEESAGLVVDCAWTRSE